jgi:long-chain acyl-CoA synthetase
VVVGSEEHLKKVLSVRDRLPNLQRIVVMDAGGEHPDPMVSSFDEVCALGAEHPLSEAEMEARMARVSEKDVAAIVYTSGTTGRPKGVMLTHRNIVSQRGILSEFKFSGGDVWMAHLPMCHVYGFSSDLMNAGYHAGTMYLLDSLDSEEIRAGLLAARPTVMNSVPRLWEKLYVQINSILSTRPPTVQKLFRWSQEVGKRAYLLRDQGRPVPLGLQLKLGLANRLFKVVKKQAGLDRLRMCSTGGGPVNPDLILFFGAMGIDLYQGFGLTETAPTTHVNTPRHHKLGTVGRPFPGVEQRIDADGEILIKGPQVMKGYLNNPQATAEAMTADGFFRTGDIGEIDAEGYLKITDRKKELIITSAGKNIAPQPIENEFNTDRYIEQVAVVGDGRKYVTALVVPEFGALAAWAKAQGIEFKDHQELIQHPQVKELMAQQVEQVNSHLARYEQIKKFTVLARPFSETGGELTPTQKLKRRVLEQKFKSEIDAMYPKD